MSPTTIYASKGKMLLLAFGSLLFILMGLILIVFDLNETQVVRDNIIGVVCIIFFGACFIFLAKKGFDRKPALVIDESGITDNSTALKVGLVKWEEIEDIQFITFSGQHFLAIYTYDKDLIVDRTTAFQKAMNQINKKLLDSQINIPYKNLKCTQEQLVEAINYFWESAYAANAYEEK